MTKPLSFGSDGKLLEFTPQISDISGLQLALDGKAGLTANTFLGTQLIRAATNQDGIEISGRTGGTSGYKATITPLALSANRTHSLPDQDGTIALRGTNTFTGKQIIDIGSGTGGILNGSISCFLTSDGATLSLSHETYGSVNGSVYSFYNIGGTRVSPSATLNGSGFMAFLCRGHDGSSTTGTKGSFGASAVANWSGSSTPLFWYWNGCKTGSITSERFMTLEEGILKIPLTTDATDKDTGSIVVEGGIASEKVQFSQTGHNVANKFRMHYDSTTGEYGPQVKLTNKTGSSTVKGTIVEASTTTDMAFQTNDANGDHPIGVVYEAGVADGSDAWVWAIGAVCQVLLVNSTASTRGYWAQTGATAGRADITNANPNASTHWAEIGHCLESKSAGTDVLAKIKLHFN